MKKVYRKAQVIVKVVERCNLACTYCYYFEGGDQTYKNKPAVMSRDTARALAGFLADGAAELGLESVAIALHGGEPFLLKPAVLDDICTELRERLQGVCEITIDAQTNGTVLNEALLKVVRKHGIRVSFSIDGLEQAHDRERRDHRGRGSFQRIRQNYLEWSRINRAEGRPEIPIIAVLDARNDYGEVVTGLHRDLGVREFNFLLPDCCHDDGIPNGASARDYGRALCEIFDAWAETDGVAVREVDQLLSRFQLARKREGAADDPGVVHHENQILVVRSDGELQIDDTYIPASDWRNGLPAMSLEATRLSDYLSLPVFDEIDAIANTLPDQCERCVWKNICHGGDIENRYSRERGFDNPSVYCEGLKMLFRHAVKFLRRNGYPAEVVRDRLRAPGGAHELRYAR